MTIYDLKKNGFSQTKNEFFHRVKTHVKMWNHIKLNMHMTWKPRRHTYATLQGKEALLLKKCI